MEWYCDVYCMRNEQNKYYDESNIYTVKITNSTLSAFYVCTTSFYNISCLKIFYFFLLTFIRFLRKIRHIFVRYER